MIQTSSPKSRIHLKNAVFGLGVSRLLLSGSFQSEDGTVFDFANQNNDLGDLPFSEADGQWEGSPGNNWWGGSSFWNGSINVPTSFVARDKTTCIRRCCRESKASSCWRICRMRVNEPLDQGAGQALCVDHLEGCKQTTYLCRPLQQRLKARGTFNGGIAQLARALAWHARGPGFESPYLHQEPATGI